MDNELKHYGVKGMKWGVRRNPAKAYVKAHKKQIKLDEAVKTARVFSKIDKDEFSNPAKAKKHVDRWNKKAEKAKTKAEKWRSLMDSTFSNVPQESIDKGKALLDRYVEKNRKYFIEDEYYY